MRSNHRYASAPIRSLAVRQAGRDSGVGDRNAQNPPSAPLRIDWSFRSTNTRSLGAGNGLRIREWAPTRRWAYPVRSHTARNTLSPVSGVSCRSRISTVTRSNMKFKSARVEHSAINSQLGSASNLSTILRVRAVSSAYNTALRTWPFSFIDCLLQILGQPEVPPTRLGRTLVRLSQCTESYPRCSR